MKEYDIIFIAGEKFADHPLSGVGILKRLLEKYGYSVAVIDACMNEKEVSRFGKPKLFFGVSAGSVDSMVRNYTPLKKSRAEDSKIKFTPTSPDRAVTVYCNWIKKYFKESKIVVGGVESSLRRFSHYDYWDNSIRKSILFDSRADILVYGPGEKQILEIASRIKNGKELDGILGTCIRTRELPEGFTEMPSHEEVSSSNKKFCEMQNLLSNKKNLAQKNGNFYVLQYKSPEYTPKDLDEYYELPFTRNVGNIPELHGFDFSVVTHRGCIGNCNFCSLRLMAGDKIVSRSEESIIREIKYITTLPNFKGNIDDFGGPSANMYGMDCKVSYSCEKACIECTSLDKSHKRLIELLRKVRQIPKEKFVKTNFSQKLQTSHKENFTKFSKVKKVFVRSGVRYDLVNPEYLKELVEHHVSGKLKIAPEHVSEDVLKMMNKNRGDLNKFMNDFKKIGKGELAFYFMTSHPGTTEKDAEILAEKLKTLKNCESVQTFTPTPMTVSTCMYYTECDPITGKKIYVPKTYKEKKDQKRVLVKKDWNGN
jgi:radical SAM superfamily enzyme YgiQ (UPF0313 family)